MKASSAILSAILSATIALPAAAHADPACTTDGYRKLWSGDRVPTPACQANLLGRVARSHGLKIGDATIIRSAEARERICDAVGRDGRLGYACQVIHRY